MTLPWPNWTEDEWREKLGMPPKEAKPKDEEPPKKPENPPKS